VIATYTLTGIRTVDARNGARMMQGLGASRQPASRESCCSPHTMGYIATAKSTVLPHAMFVAIGAEVLFGIFRRPGRDDLTRRANWFNAKGVFAALLLATVVSAILRLACRSRGRSAEKV